MAEGCSNQEIANRLFLSTGTVKSYSSRLFDKIGVRDRTQAVLHSLKTGLAAKLSAPARKT
ncbi:response regulator transcription factor [bacterium]|nr:response regulator transcription factor [bacterium]